jgi:hypothetical protein
MKSEQHLLKVPSFWVHSRVNFLANFSHTPRHRRQLICEMMKQAEIYTKSLQHSRQSLLTCTYWRHLKNIEQKILSDVIQFSFKFMCFMSTIYRVFTFTFSVFLSSSSLLSYIFVFIPSIWIIIVSSVSIYIFYFCLIFWIQNDDGFSFSKPTYLSYIQNKFLKYYA